MRFVMSKAIHPTRFLEHTLWCAPLSKIVMHADLSCLVAMVLPAGSIVCLDSFTTEAGQGKATAQEAPR